LRRETVTPEPDILAFDTSAAHCAAALLNEDVVLAERFEAMKRGQAERLMPLLETLLADRGVTWRDLTALVVGIGPGNFTGIRIAVSAARGLGLALRLPVFGVSSFEVMRDPTGLGAHPAEIVSLPAPRDQAYVQHFRYGKPQSAPRVIDPDDPPADLRLPVNMRVRGFRADDIALAFDAEADPAEAGDIAARIGKVADWRRLTGEVPVRPAPLYVRAADAAPPRDPAPVILP